MISNNYWLKKRRKKNIKSLINKAIKEKNNPALVAIISGSGNWFMTKGENSGN